MLRDRGEVALEVALRLVEGVAAELLEHRLGEDDRDHRLGDDARRGDRALVFTGARNLDELSLIGPNEIWETADGQIQRVRLEPADVDLPENRLEDITGRDAAHNAEVIRRVLAGEPGPIRDTVVLNAAAGLVARRADVGRPLAERIGEAIPRAAQALDSGAAQRLLEDWIRFLTEGDSGESSISV